MKVSSRGGAGPTTREERTREVDNVCVCVVCTVTASVSTSRKELERERDGDKFGPSWDDRERGTRRRRGVTVHAPALLNRFKQTDRLCFCPTRAHTRGA